MEVDLARSRVGKLVSKLKREDGFCRGSEELEIQKLGVFGKLEP